MTGEQQTVSKRTRRIMLVLWTLVFLSNASRVMNSSKIERFLSAVMMLVSAGLTLYYWLMPISDGIPPKHSRDDQ